MKALRFVNGDVEYSLDTPLPECDSHCDVMVRVAFAGICRTDIGIAEGRINCHDGVVLGHEFCGTIVAFANSFHPSDLKIGDIVSANPMAFGHPGSTDVMCGKDCNGCFAEYIAIPHEAVEVLSPDLLSPLGAFLEPVAAALAPFKFRDKFKDNVAIYGNNRIALLTLMVGKAMGCGMIPIISGERLEECSFGTLIETQPDNLSLLVKSLRPGGVLVLKSRGYDEKTIIPNDVAMKEILIQGARYGEFQTAHHLLVLSNNRVDPDVCFETLFGDVFELSEYLQAFAIAKASGAKKIFFRICAD